MSEGPRKTKVGDTPASDSMLFSALQAEAGSCRFLGRDLPEGSKIRWEGKTYRCAAGNWTETE